MGFKSPIGNLKVCYQAIKELAANQEKFNFLLADIDMEEQEHAIEVQVPFLVYCLGPSVEIVPIYIGEMNQAQMDLISDVLIPHFEREDSLFLAVSNLTRWGER